MVEFPLQAFLITVFFVFTCALEIGLVEKIDDNCLVLTPKRVYNHIKVNKFGSWAVVILFRIINPIGTIGKFLHFAFTNGREKND